MNATEAQSIAGQLRALARRLEELHAENPNAGMRSRQRTGKDDRPLVMVGGMDARAEQIFRCIAGTAERLLKSVGLMDVEIEDWGYAGFVRFVAETAGKKSGHGLGFVLPPGVFRHAALALEMAASKLEATVPSGPAVDPALPRLASIFAAMAPPWHTLRQLPTNLEMSQTTPPTCQEANEAEAVPRSEAEAIPKSFAPPEGPSCYTDQPPGCATPIEPQQEVPESRRAALEKLPRAAQMAYWSFRYTESKVGRQLKDREAWDLLREEGLPAKNRFADYELPEFDTWARYLRQARESLGEQKYSPRGSRAARSVVRRRDL